MFTLKLCQKLFFLQNQLSPNKRLKRISSNNKKLNQCVCISSYTVSLAHASSISIKLYRRHDFAYYVFHYKRFQEKRIFKLINFLELYFA